MSYQAFDAAEAAEDLTLSGVREHLDARLDAAALLLAAGRPGPAAVELAAVRSEYADLAPILSVYGCADLQDRLDMLADVANRWHTRQHPSVSASRDASRRRSVRQRPARLAAARALSCTR